MHAGNYSICCLWALNLSSLEAALPPPAVCRVPSASLVLNCRFASWQSIEKVSSISSWQLHSIFLGWHSLSNQQQTSCIKCWWFSIKHFKMPTFREDSCYFPSNLPGFHSRISPKDRHNILNLSYSTVVLSNKMEYSASIMYIHVYF